VSVRAKTLIKMMIMLYPPHDGDLDAPKYEQ